MALQFLFEHAVRQHPDRTAIVDPVRNLEITYRELQSVSNRLRDRLVQLGVQPRDRVGLYLKKSIDSIGSIYGILKAGAAYVPVDPGAPASRNAFILNDCGVKAVIVAEQFVADLQSEMAKLGDVPAMIVVGEATDGLPLDLALDRLEKQNSAPACQSHASAPEDLAYILYTSGSTGKPKGVMLTHENAESFLDWCSEVFQPAEGDRFSSHAPLHFDLSILDVHLSLKHGAALILFGEELGKDPAALAELIATQRITNWYSAPSILSLLSQYGKLDTHDYSALKMVLFAGEVFPVKHLNALRRLLPAPRYFNLYGPTETNVCTYFELPPQIEETRDEPYPIGKVCSHLESLVIDGDGKEVAAGGEGELVIRGPGVTSGYWNLAERTAVAFHRDGDGKSWYKTGDVVVEDADGNYLFRGRRDRMVKKRGYRIELGEIETCLYQNPDVEEAGVVAVADDGGNLAIKAFVSPHAGKKLSIIALKAFCAQRIPIYMAPDAFVFLDSLPKTSTDKIDYQKLLELA